MFDENGELTEEHKRTLDRILINLEAHLSTAEGMETFERMERIMHAIESRTKASVQDLPPKERRVLTYIKKALKQGHSPSVREVTQAMGLKSSRSGQRVLNSLLTKGVIRRSVEGKIIFPQTCR